jgi:hypothetical protein
MMCTSVYDFFRDQGSIISGILAVGVGWVIVVVTRKAAADQVATMREQIKHASAESIERDSRQIAYAIRLITIETARLKLMVDHRYGVAGQESGVGDWVKSSPDIFKIFTTGVLRDAAGATALLDAAVLKAMTDLIAAVDNLNSNLETKLAVKTLKWTELKADLERIGDRADEVQAQVAIFENRLRKEGLLA